MEHCREGDTKCWFSVHRGLFFWPHLSGDEGCQCTEITLKQQFL